MSFPRAVVGLVFGCAVFSGAATAVAHPFHICVGQMQWNRETQRWEISIRLHPQDLETAMSRRLGRAIGLDDAGFEERAVDYLQDHFFLLQTSPETDVARI